jgi:hypothetical protein
MHKHTEESDIVTTEQIRPSQSRPEMNQGSAEDDHSSLYPCLQVNASGRSPTRQKLPIASQTLSSKTLPKAEETLSGFGADYLDQIGFDENRGLAYCLNSVYTRLFD